MRFAKLILTGIIGMFIIMTLLSLLIPSKVVVSRTTLINNTSVDKIQQQLQSFNNWKNWYPVFKNETVQVKIDTVSNTAQINYAGKTAELQFTGSTDSSISFLTIAPGENDIANQIIAIAVPNQNNVQVEWRAINKLKWYPWEKFYGIFVDKLTGGSYEAGLQGLKEYLETH